MSKEILINASDVQRTFFHKFIESYGWSSFEYGCYLEHKDVALLLIIDENPNLLEVCLKQNATAHIDVPIGSNCKISLRNEGHEPNLDIFSKNLFLVTKRLEESIIKHSNQNEFVIVSLKSFLEHLNDNIER